MFFRPIRWGEDFLLDVPKTFTEFLNEIIGEVNGTVVFLFAPFIVFYDSFVTELWNWISGLGWDWDRYDVEDFAFSSIALECLGVIVAAFIWTMEPWIPVSAGVVFTAAWIVYLRELWW